MQPIRTDISTVHVIFKTHLDVGFTDYAHNVVDQYMSQYIPEAIALARKMKNHHPEMPFCWTVGSWLIYEYLERATENQKQELALAIQDNLVAWHGVPFTTHTELMDEKLFRYSLSLSKELDMRFGKTTIAAKMTDVPGHTRAIIPLLADAGIKFFHVGVNPAATVPDVPGIFIWHDEATDTRLVVMYQLVYGDVMILPGTSEALALVFTGDNLGPPSQESVYETYANLRKQFPNATFIGSTLDAVAKSILEADHDLPVITSEIGDTWIQGIGTDPTKVSQYRELLRLRNTWIDERRIDEVTLKAFHQALMMIPEHTWGMDLKTHLNDYENYDTATLAKVRSHLNFRNFEESWSEQREYINDAIDALHGTPLYEEAKQCLHNIRPQKPDLTKYQIASSYSFEDDHWSISIDRETGSITHLSHKETGTILLDSEHPFGLLTYETYSSVDYDRYWHQYIRDREFSEIRIWAHPDNTKPNLQVTEHGLWHPHLQAIYSLKDEEGLHILGELMLPAESKQIGAPNTIYIEYCFGSKGQIDINLQWFDKPACRLPEAFWLTFKPITHEGGMWSIQKLGSQINPSDVINKGARTLHGFNQTISYQNDEIQIKIDSWDAVLVAPGKPSLLDFHNQLPDINGGVHVNLFNNVWGTNFPMWFEDDARFRFTVKITETK